MFPQYLLNCIMPNTNNIKIFCFYYKDSPIPVQNDLYLPVMAGNISVNSKLKIPGDDTGDSISEKNYFNY